MGYAYGIVAAVIGLLLSGAIVWADKTDCLSCHREQNRGLYQQWQQSAHGANDVGCIDCHGAAAEDPDAFEHHGSFVATLVTPNDCAVCHEKEAQETMDSYHAHAGEILDSGDAYLAHVTAGYPVVIVGCEACHGARVKIDPQAANKLSSQTWPNSGIGRINPDGSKGACNACHSRHSFSKYQARQPENCGKCHLGPDHPQKEIFEASKHGIAYRGFRESLNMDRDSWVVGDDYYAAPTCATCHMSATADQAVSHDVGDRISWTLRPPMAKPKNDAAKKRTAMQQVCLSCHQQSFVDGHYYQFDALVKLYNQKFARPATEIMIMIKDKELLENPASFANEIEWDYYELWHHQGRRARMGAAMMAPDYAWWHGMYEVAHSFYFTFLPKARAFGDPQINGYIDELLTDDPMHAWLNSSTADIKSAIRDGSFQKIYYQLFEQQQ